MPFKSRDWDQAFLFFNSYIVCDFFSVIYKTIRPTSKIRVMNMEFIPTHL